MKLWLVRHARPLIDPGVCYGRLDVAADPAATQACALSLAAALPPDLRVLASGLRRARQLAQALLALRADLRLAVDERLGEMDFGQWEGVPWHDIPEDAVDRWARDFARHRFGGVESAADVLGRVAQALAAMSALDEAVWITHAGVIRAVHHLVRHGDGAAPTAATWPSQAPAFGEWTVLTIGEQA
ncbi:MAG TPA: histidine phosphatase family protein [Bordetella sp.]